MNKYSVITTHFLKKIKPSFKDTVSIPGQITKIEKVKINYKDKYDSETMKNFFTKVTKILNQKS